MGNIIPPLSSEEGARGLGKNKKPRCKAGLLYIQ
jgi:hypothetical protein